MFEKEEAFNFIRDFLKIENAESRIKTDRRKLLDEIVFNLQSKIAFQNIFLLSMPLNERRKPTQDETKANFVSGRGGLCFDMNISTFHLLSAAGFEAALSPSTVSTATIALEGNHVVVIVRNLEKEGDKFMVDIACGHPCLAARSLDFEKESPIYVDSYIEYKYIKLDGKVLKMQRKGDPLTARGVQENSELEFWIDDWRRFLTVDLDVETTDASEFDKCHREVYINPAASPFFVSHWVGICPGGKTVMVINNKAFTDVDGELAITELEGGDEAIKSKIIEICPALRELLPVSLLHWRQTVGSKGQVNDSDPY